MKKQEKKKYNRYTRAHLTVRNVRFWLCYLVLVVLLGFGIARVYTYFDENLKVYEQNQYSYLAEEMASVFTEKRYGEMYAIENAVKNCSETEEEYTAYVQEKIGDSAISYKRVASSDANTMRYIVTADGKSFAEFTLKRKLDENGTPMSFGFEAIPVVGYTVGGDLYEKGDYTLNFLQPVTYDYTVPSYATVYVNGNALDVHSTVGQSDVFFADHLPEPLTAYKLISYRFDCALDNAIIEVKDADGNSVPLTDKGNDTFVYEIIYDDSLAETFAPLAEEFASRWCSFSTHNIKLNYLLALTVKDSTAYNLINSYEKTWITQADSLKVQELATCNFLQISENAVCCEVSCNYHTVSKGKQNDYPLRMRLYFTLSGNEWKVYDFELLQTETEAK